MKEEVLRRLNQIKNDINVIENLEYLADNYSKETIEVCFENGMNEVFWKIVKLYEYTSPNSLEKENITRYFFDPLSSANWMSFNLPDNVVDKLEEMYLLDINNMRNIKIYHMHPRQISGIGNPIHKIGDVVLYAEQACLKACIELYNLNIQTVANDVEGCMSDSKTTNGKARIDISLTTLSEENKEVVKKMIETGAATINSYDSNCATIMVNVSSDDTVGEVSDRLMYLVSKFKMQDIFFGKFTEEEINDYFYSLTLSTIDEVYPNEPNMSPLRKAEIMECYYDPEEQIYWTDINYYNRHLDYLEYIKRNEQNR